MPWPTLVLTGEAAAAVARRSEAAVIVASSGVITEASCVNVAACGCGSVAETCCDAVSVLGDAGRQSSLKALPSDVDARLLRATAVSSVLAGYGHHLSSKDAKARDYALSVPVSELDDFLSHDWGTPRFSKLLALLFLYNQTDACVASCLAAVLLASVGAWHGMFFLAKMICPLVWALVYMFGQRLRTAGGSTRYVFLDKLCIDQTDVAKKTAGILGLAGFLRSSKRLVVLWSPRYFTRLWCAYELAAWSYLHRSNPRPVKFMPVSRAKILLEEESWKMSG
eukprot:TRINITY_DN41244_c0_g1_i1.p1 TRINITY_DN41244_c0_g1~~TRINITY_DN41244_c0_g1_i1.p1  ORF type:complete len:281 (+),score=30.65 TRINITY_DN41244_c0_g1_i1:174-1016(+)